MTAKNNIPADYKDSAVGVIPQEWEVKALGEAYKLQGGYAFKSELFADIGIPIVRISNLPMDSNIVDITDCVYYPNTESIKEQFIIKQGMLLIAMSGATTGKTAVYNNQNSSYLNQRVGMFCSKNDDITYNYLLQLVQSPLYSNALKPLLIAGAQPNIAPSDVENMKFPVPPMEEQWKIAEILGVWDEAIEKQSRLIERLELRKRALMQRLLTGRTRLPGFSTPWQKVKLGEICKRVTRRNEENNQNVMTISAQKGFVSQTDFFNKSVASSTLDNYYLVLKDEFCYNKSYSNGYPMGAIKRLKEADKAVVTTLYICFSIADSKRLDINFFEQFCENGEFNQGLMKIANEGGRAHGLLNVTPTDFFSLVMLLPTLPEQKAIAEVLTTADDEIATNRKKLDALRLQKRGLMQQLLTGKTRVKFKIL